MIQEDLRYSEKYTVDGVITRLLDFRRLWANFHFPRMLRAIESIVNDVQIKRGERKLCEYSTFANLVENYFDNPSLVALEEYGLPIQIAKKYEGKILSEEATLDSVIERLKEIDIDRLKLSSVEKRFMNRIILSL